MNMEEGVFKCLQQKARVIKVAGTCLVTRLHKGMDRKNNLNALASAKTHKV